MSEKQVFCQRKKQNLPALESAPFPGELGLKIQTHISQEAWKEWLAHQTKLINEFRLRPASAEAKKFLNAQMHKFLFEGEESNPPDFKPEK